MGSEKIVVTGWGAVTPLGNNASETWTSLFDGKDARRSLTGPDWKGFRETPTAALASGFQCPVGLEGRDRSLQLGAAAGEEAWKAAGLSNVPGERIGTTFSSSKGGVVSLLKGGDGPFLMDFFPSSAGQLLRQRLGFGGPALSVASACSTGLGSVEAGVRILEEGRCDVILAGSTESSIHPLIVASFRNMGILTKRKGGPSPFDLERDGFLMGEGAGVLVLEREGSAVRRGAVPLARLTACVLGADGNGFIDLEPGGGPIVTVIERALQAAGLGTGDIGYINAHGTGTRLNDRVESQALSRVFGGSGAWVSSTKGATGHLLGAAGSVEAVLSVLALREGRMPSTRNLEHPDPGCLVRHVEKGGMETGLENVLSLSYGFGGQLAAVIFSKL